MSAQPRRRLDAATRRAMLLASARSVFAEVGYASCGLAEVAQRAEVSKTLLYHYFPDGRPELYREVLDDLTDQLVAALRGALHAPVAPQQRVRLLVEHLLEHFDAQPDAFRLLFLEPWGTGEPAIVGQAMAIRVRLGAELASLLSSAGARTATTQAAAASTIGALLHLCELWLAEQIGREDALEVGTSFVLGGLEASGMLDPRHQA